MPKQEKDKRASIWITDIEASLMEQLGDSRAEVLEDAWQHYLKYAARSGNHAYAVDVSEDAELAAELDTVLEGYGDDEFGVRMMLRQGVGLPLPNEEDKRMCGSYVTPVQLSSFELNLVGNVLWQHAEDNAYGNMEDSFKMLARKFHSHAKTRD